MKKIEVKNGNKTTIKIVADNYEPEEDFSCKDIAANGGFSTLINKEDWDRIFGAGKEKRIKRMTERYMVLVANQEDLDLTVREFDLTKNYAEMVAKDSAEDYETVIVCPHGKFDYR